MKDFLRELCGQAGINVIYTNNKITILSNGINNNIPFIRAHKIFMYCPDGVAQAIIGYYSNQLKSGEKFDLIHEYVEENFKHAKYKIIPPDVEFEKRMMKSVTASSMDNPTSLIEFEITQISVKDFWGDITNTSQDHSIRLKGAEVLEVDIEVDEFDE